MSFNPQSVTAGGSGSQMTITTSASTPAGNYPVTVTGTSVVGAAHGELLPDRADPAHHHLGSEHFLHHQRGRVVHRHHHRLTNSVADRVRGVAVGA